MSFSTDGEEITHFTDEDDRSDDEYFQEIGDVTSFRDIPFQSEEMKHLLKLENPPDDDKYGSRVTYNATHMFPNWILDNAEWQSTEAKNKDNKVSEVLQTPYNQRTQEQTSTLIHWLMSVWETANMMGFKRCGAMTKVFHFLTYEPGENIITEGERGLTFYIVISGNCVVHKEGIGNVAALSKGQSFGEIALTQGKDLRSATVQAVTKVEVLRLHKIDYDHFVKDIQLAERRENLQVLKSCRLFDHWSRAKIQKMVTTCLRKSYDAGEYVFHQGDVPDNIYFIVDGTISIIKEIHIVVRNRWPVGNHEWAGVAKKKIKPYIVNELGRGSYFGELSIVKNKNRTASARAKTRCTVLSLDKLEFVHLLRSGKTMETVSNFVTDYQDDREILNTMADLKGGPSTTAQLNEYVKTADDPNETIGSPQYTKTATASPEAPVKPAGTRRTTIVRIPTNVYEVIGPNQGLPSPGFAKKASKSPKKSPSRSPVRGKAKQVSFPTLSKPTVKTKDVKPEKKSSSHRFRQQLQAAVAATETNKSGSRGGTTIVEDPTTGAKYEPKHGAAAMQEGGVDLMRSLIDNITTANRKLHYLDDATNLKSVGGLQRGHIRGGHKSLSFMTSTHGTAMTSPSPVSPTRFEMNPELLDHRRNKTPVYTTNPKAQPKPVIKCEGKSHPVMMMVNSVVMTTSKGRKVKTSDTSEVSQYVDAVVNNQPVPEKQVMTRSLSRQLSRKMSRQVSDDGRSVATARAASPPFNTRKTYDALPGSPQQRPHTSPTKNKTPAFR
mmetsp:Transcript_26500/g.39362  ORF Transcript_26500/g.39362 Transcript_26500/m.39362 type:complete len:777 (-) Transcript_26500:222-2552(-)